MTDVLLVFLKAPRPGEVKTRLVPALGAPLAAELYRALAEIVLERTAPIAGGYDRACVFAPAGAGPEMRAWIPGERWTPQVDGDLGRRMEAAFEEAFRRGARRAVLIGSDAPWVDAALVKQAFDGLADADVVLGPAEDGGYYLVGLRRPQSALFREIPWSTPAVLPDTMRAAAAQGLAVATLEALADIDDLDDLRRTWPALRLLLGSRPTLVSALERILSV